MSGIALSPDIKQQYLDDNGQFTVEGILTLIRFSLFLPYPKTFQNQSIEILLESFIHEQELFYKFLLESMKCLADQQSRSPENLLTHSKSKKQNKIVDLKFNSFQEIFVGRQQNKFKTYRENSQFSIKSRDYQKDEGNKNLESQTSQSPKKIKISVKRNNLNEIILEKQETNKECDDDLFDNELSQKSNTPINLKSLSCYQIDSQKDIVNMDQIQKTVEKNKITNENFINAILLIEKELKSVNIRYRIQLAEQKLLNEEYFAKIQKLESIINNNNNTKAQISSFLQKQVKFYNLNDDHSKPSNTITSSRLLSLSKTRTINLDTQQQEDSKIPLQRKSIAVGLLDNQQQQGNFLQAPNQTLQFQKRLTGVYNNMLEEDFDDAQSQLSLSFDSKIGNSLKDEENSDNHQDYNIKDTLKLFIPMISGLNTEISDDNQKFNGVEHMFSKDLILLRNKPGSHQATSFAHKILGNPEIIKAKNIFKSNSLLKIISNVYRQLLNQIGKGNSLKSELIFLIYDQFESQYGFVKNTVEAKLIQVLKVAQYYCKIPKIRLFLKFIKILPFIENSLFSADINDFLNYLGIQSVKNVFNRIFKIY